MQPAAAACFSLAPKRRPRARPRAHLLARSLARARAPVGAPLVKGVDAFYGDSGGRGGRTPPHTVATRTHRHNIYACLGTLRGHPDASMGVGQSSNGCCRHFTRTRARSWMESERSASRARPEDGGPEQRAERVRGRETVREGARGTRATPQPTPRPAALGGLCHIGCESVIAISC